MAFRQNPVSVFARAAKRSSVRRIARKTAVSAILLTGLSATPAPADEIPVTPLRLTSHLVTAFSLAEPDRTRFGPLEWVGGLDIEADTKHFGGLSALGLIGDGNDLIAISDTGLWLNARLRLDAAGRPLALEAGELRSLRDADGAPLEGKHFSDAEAMALETRNGVTTAYIGFERVDRIMAYPLDAAGRPGLPTQVPTPFHEGTTRYSKGIEAVALAPDGHPLAGTFIAIAERTLDDAGNMRAWLVGGPTPGEFAVSRTDEFDVTDADFLPNGDLLLLERRYRLSDGVAMRLRVVKPAELAPGSIVQGNVVLTANMSYTIDNMEGIRITRDAAGQTLVNLISDDNHSILQRNLFLRFLWIGETGSATPPPQVPVSAE